MEYTKKCTKCGRELPLDQFQKQKFRSGNIGYQSWCKDCVKIMHAKWYINHSEEVKKRTSQWQNNNPSKVKANLARWRKDNPEYSREWRKNNQGRYKNINTNYQRRRSASDPDFRIKKNIRTAIYFSLNNKGKTNHTTELLGCSIEYLRQYLEAHFHPGMTWENYGRHGWHIDHIIPLSYFDFNDPEQQRRAWHYTNLQPLWAADNIRKKDIIEERQLILI